MMRYKNIFIVGVNGSIGAEIAKQLRQKFPESKIFGSFNSDNISESLDSLLDGIIRLDVRSEDSWSDLGEYLLKLDIKFDLILSTVGTLKGTGNRPEKSLRDISLEQLTSVFSINSFHAVLLGREFRAYVSNSENARIVYLSAMVGSIGENDIGGWYSYRASKTALNMFVKNMSIEFSRSKPNLKILSIHPGTTDTSFSNKYLKGVKHKVWSAKETADHILSVVDENSYDSGSFLNWDGRTIEW